MKLTGKIVRGKGRGKGLNLPTINLDVKPEDLEFGVYAVKVYVDGDQLKGAMNWGPQPTFKDGEVVAEIHILDFDGDLYDLEVLVEVVERLREVKAFDSKEALLLQIEKDIEAIRALLV